MRRLWAAAVAFTVYASVLPFAFVHDTAIVREHWIQAVQRSAPAQWAGLSKSDVAQNILLFIPIGALCVITFRGRRPAVAVLMAFGVGVVLSTTCETLQLFTVDRLTSAWDIWANTSGALVGALAMTAVASLAMRAESILPSSTVEREQLFLCASTAALVVVAACEPFDITLDVGTVWQNVKPLVQGGLVQGRPITDELLTTLRFAMLSSLLVAWLRVRGWSGFASASVAIVACVLFATALEGTQFLIASRSPALQDLAAEWAGALFGGIIGPVMARWLSGPVLITIATAIAAIPFYLGPFDLSSTRSPFGFVPFLAYYQFTSLQTLSHVTDLMLIYAPIGFAIVWSGTRRGLASSLLVVAGLAGLLEFSQGWVIGRYPDITDIGVALLGGLAGATIAVRGRAQLGAIAC